MLCSPVDHPNNETLTSLLPPKEANVKGTGFNRIASLLLPFQIPGDKREQWIQNDMLRKRLLDEWNTQPITNYHHTEDFKPHNKLAKLPRSKARQLYRIRCQTPRLDKHAAFNV
ncbi:uncharacterized protein H6S33_003664 [Morchella sextelata]|jgi:hypothetical protein|uniref:uncharacterized protein n=1 Tax=Morchella sextelata TaxID=1174677 RepID=UPI001D059C5F|nr:uncharacterized protein H6S33_003664 [Morchella sextelata]KAH0606830.1 hypothetical protein H6S33_003664 [Morchella sextelata]